MKIRSGFVSNSSSSSFVLMGFEYSKEDILAKAGYISADDDDWDEKEQAIRKYFKKLKSEFGDLEIIESSELGIKSDVLGYMLNTSLEESSTVTTDVKETTSKLTSLMAGLGVDKKINIYSGSRYC